MNLLALFDKCVNSKYIQVENAGDYYTEKIGNTLYIYLECSNGSEDWKNNFDFPARPYKRMGATVWFAHRGFLRVWKSIEPYIKNSIMDKSVSNIVTIGYSHGAAVAALCHEYIWYNRPDIRDAIRGYGFGCPRVFWGLRFKKIKKRWSTFTVIRNINDIVTHIPPAILGYSHIGNMLTIGEKGKYNSIDAHRPENIKQELYSFNELIR